ncbi:Molybdenum-containing formylmethanofuran dehydrogenase 1 subunit C [uncultured archaeon]|nr:Molybdenum-containing formylmethanofuran dehydrogenase 1 subunit C [uncultured archaeon]
MDIELTAPVDCLCDFTYDFYWQHNGSRLNPSGIIPHQRGTSYTYSDLVEHLKSREDVHIKGGAGRRLGSSLGVDLTFFGGSGNSLKVGSIIVDGDVDTRMGISMISGVIYVGGNAKQPLGNVIEVESDRAGYHKYRSITEMLTSEPGEALISPNTLKEDTLAIKDGLPRDTIAARLDSDKSVVVDGNAGMSTGILMKQGFVHVQGDAGLNTGVLLRGGKLIVNNTGEFAGAYMKGGILIIGGKAGGYVGANMKGGVIFFKGKAMPKATFPDESDTKMLVRLLEISHVEAMMFKKYVPI